MQARNLVIVFGAIVVYAISSCSHDPDLEKVRVIGFNKEVLPIFQSNCTTSGCHSETKQMAGYNLSNYNGIMKGVSAGDPNGSEVYDVITSNYSTMPPAPAKALTQDQRTLIYVWIKQNAQNN